MRLFNLMTLLGLLLMSTSCKISPDCPVYPSSCGVDNPLESLSWLQEKVMELEAMEPETQQYFFIKKATIGGQTVFIFNNCCPFCNTGIPVYSCKGQAICESPGSCPNFADSLKNRSLLWQPQEYACGYP